MGSLAAFPISLLVFVADAVELKWAIAAGALGLVGIGLARNSLNPALHLSADRCMNCLSIPLRKVIQVDPFTLISIYPGFEVRITH